MTIDLPYLDEHTVRIDAPRNVVWTGLQRYIESMLHGTERNPLVALLGRQPRAGFDVVESVEQDSVWPGGIASRAIGWCSS
ncbi:hypothetical protein MTER_34550 [Mycolicibacter terrae]|uniref:Uncharacterized protein n=1 Tax=Mycolicibacter terrae TaxID=1788 RepID=A0AAD1MJJ2_9MYCO|nr:hypothetical protein [Mycolicibacter terrae]BBX24044.1 hypothetical protein MTER_34550 [Mycolicibacter terrae]SNV57020.1 Uncharacterised protein [Mycolicibacter terrae]